GVLDAVARVEGLKIEHRGELSQDLRYAGLCHAHQPRGVALRHAPILHDAEAAVEGGDPTLRFAGRWKGPAAEIPPDPQRGLYVLLGKAEAAEGLLCEFRHQAF